MTSSSSQDIKTGPAHQPETLEQEADPKEAFASASKTGVPRLLLILIGAAAGWVALQGIMQLHEIVAPLFLALNLVIASYPVKRFLDSKKCPSLVSSILVALIVLVVLIAFFWSIGWGAAALVSELPNYSSQFSTLYDQTFDLLSRAGIHEEQLQKWAKDFQPGSLLGAGQKALSSVSGFLGILMTIILIVFFLISDLMGVQERQGIVAKHHPGLDLALTEFAQGVRRYWVVSTVFGLIVAVLDLGALMILGVPLAMVWAVLAFVTNYIPNIGFVIGVIPPALMALLANGPWSALIVIILYSVLNFVVQSLIQPKFTGDAVGVTPLVSFLSLLFWATILGPLGTLLALPATLFIKALFVDADPSIRWLNAYIAAKPRTAEPHLPHLPRLHRKGNTDEATDHH